MKRAFFLAMFLMFLLVFFAACDSNDTPPVDTSKTETSAVVTEPVATLPAESTDQGTDEPSTVPTETDPTVTDPMDTDPVVTDPIETDPVESNPVETETTHTHAWSDWQTTKEATCTDAGVKERTCACGEKETQDIGATGHTEVIDEAVAPTCTETGLTEGKHCSACEAVLTAQKTVEALGHTPGSAASCTTTQTCTVCGTELASATGHSFGEWYTTKEPTEAEKGEKRRDCANCDEYETALIAALAHSHDKWDTITLKAVAPTCTATGLTEGKKCSGCGETLIVQEVIPATGHKFGAWYQTKAPTEAAQGQKRRDCANCDEYETTPIAALAHKHDKWDTIKLNAVTPTCTATGLTEGKKCSGCGEILVAQEVIPATGHSMSNWTQTKAPTCTVAGTEKRECSKCDHEETRSVAATGHSYQAVVTAPTCTEKGYTTHTCHCGDSYVNSYVSALGHSFGEWYTTKEPTEAEKGEKRHDCANCDEYETTPIAALAHNHNNWDTVTLPAVAPTCTATGLTEGKKCSGCGEVLVAQEVIPATGHSYSASWTSDETYHWHSATCEHSSEIADKAKHTFDANNNCTVCQFYTQLDTPVIDRVEYDMVYWNEVDHADMYLVRVNGDYEYKTRSTSCDLSSVKNSEGKVLTVSSRKAPIQIKVQVIALANGQYAASEWSEIDSSYTYVPAYSDDSAVKTLTGYKIGYGYNLIKDEYLRITNSSSLSVFDVSKLLNLGRYNVTPNAAGGSTYYSYSSVDEFITKNEAGFDVSMNVKIPMAGTLKTHMNAVGSEHFKNYAYNQIFVADVAVTVADHELLDLRDEYLQYCLSFDFLDVLNRRTLATEHMSDEELAAYIYDNYGTHVILGVTTGGSYTAQYTVSTNDITIAENLKKVSETGINVNFDDIFGVDIGVDLTASTDKSWKTQTTEAYFNTRFTGSTGGATFDPSPSSLSSAVKEWQNKIAPTSVRFTKNGAISMVSLIRTVDSGLADAFEAYVEARSDETYKEMYGQYEKNLTRLVSAPTVEDGKNVIRIDLSSFQRSGSMENAYDPNFLENILTIYPVMYGVKIDKIIICGGFDEATGQQNLINSFSVKLSKEWNRDVEIVVENLGVICTSDYGLIDTSSITKKINVTVSYSGMNMIRETDGEYHFHAQNGDTYYEFYFDPSDVDGMEFTTTDIDGSSLSIPIANRNGYSFVGWYVGDTQVTDSLGVLLQSYTATGERVTLQAKWTKNVVIILNHQEADASVLDYLYPKQDGSIYEDAGLTHGINAITVPTKAGYIFGGYYESISNNHTLQAQGEKQVIAPNGVIDSTVSYTESIELFALWIKDSMSVELPSASLPVTKVVTMDWDVVALQEAGCTGFVVVVNYSANGSLFSVNKANIFVTSKSGERIFALQQKIAFLKDDSFAFVLPIAQLQNENQFHIVWEEASGSLDLKGGDVSITALYGDRVAVILDPNGGYVSDITKIVVFEDNYGTLSTPTRSGFTFQGWYLDGNLITEDSVVTNKETHKLVAKWTPNTYRIEYNANGGSGSMDPTKDCVYGDPVYLRANSFTRQGWTFTGWNTKADGSGISYDDQESVNIAVTSNGATVKLYAQWVKIEGTGGYTSSREKEIGKDTTTTEKYGVGLSRSELQAAGYTKLKITLSVYGYENRFLASVKPIVKIYHRNGSTTMASQDGSNWPEDMADSMSEKVFVFEVSLDALNDNGQIMVGYSASGGACWLMGKVYITASATK